MTDRTTRWTDTELAALREHYPRGGIAAAQKVLPYRSEWSIRGQAKAMKLRVIERTASASEQAGADLREKVLRLVLASPGITSTELCATCYRQRTTIMRYTKELSAAGLIERRLTGRGRDMCYGPPGFAAPKKCARPDAEREAAYQLQWREARAAKAMAAQSRFSLDATRTVRVRSVWDLAGLGALPGMSEGTA